jgi:hypothetical protein
VIEANLTLVPSKTRFKLTYTLATRVIVDVPEVGELLIIDESLFENRKYKNLIR